MLLLHLLLISSYGSQTRNYRHQHNWPPPLIGMKKIRRMRERKKSRGQQWVSKRRWYLSVNKIPFASNRTRDVCWTTFSAVYLYFMKLKCIIIIIESLDYCRPHAKCRQRSLAVWVPETRSSPKTELSWAFLEAGIGIQCFESRLTYIFLAIFRVEIRIQNHNL